jgi:hypothetical protein
MSEAQDQTRSQLQDWATAHAGLNDTLSPNVQANHDHVMRFDHDHRLLAASDTIDETLDWNSGRGHLIVTQPGLPDSALNALTVIGFTPDEIAAAVTDRIDENGNLTTEDIVAATADLTGVLGTEDDYLEFANHRATSREAISYAEDAAYRDEATRVDTLSVSDLLAETGHPDLDSARQAVAEKHGYASVDDFDAALTGEWDQYSNTLHESMSTTDTAVWVTRDTADHELTQDAVTTAGDVVTDDLRADAYGAHHDTDVDDL